MENFDAIWTLIQHTASIDIGPKGPNFRMTTPTRFGPGALYEQFGGQISPLSNGKSWRYVATGKSGTRLINHLARLYPADSLPEPNFNHFLINQWAAGTFARLDAAKIIREASAYYVAQSLIAQCRFQNQPVKEFYLADRYPAALLSTFESGGLHAPPRAGIFETIPPDDQTLLLAGTPVAYPCEPPVDPAQRARWPWEGNSPAAGGF